MKLFLKILIAILLPSAISASFIFLPPLVLTKSLATPESTQVSVDPATLEIVCPGAFVQLGGQDGTDLGLIERVGDPKIIVHSSQGEVVDVSGSAPGDFSKFISEGTNQSSDLLSAIQYQVLDESRAKGLAATNCSVPQTSGWFVSGEASVGTESVLILANPNAVEAAIDLEIFAGSGNSQTRITLAASETRLVPLARFVVADAYFTLRYQSDSAGVSVVMQNRSTSGLTATGVELIAPILEPSKVIWIPGVQDLTGGFSIPILRIFNPAEVAANIRISEVSVVGATTQRMLEIAPGTIDSIELETSAGAVGLKLDSDVEVVAAVKNFSLNPVLDFAWALPVQELESIAFISNPFDGSTLNLLNPNAEEVSVTLKTSNGYQSISVAPEAMVKVEVPKGDILLQSGTTFSANLEIFGAGGYSVITLEKNQNLGSDIEVLLY